MGKCKQKSLLTNNKKDRYVVYVLAYKSFCFSIVIKVI